MQELNRNFEERAASEDNNFVSQRMFIITSKCNIDKVSSIQQTAKLKRKEKMIQMM